MFPGGAWPESRGIPWESRGTPTPMSRAPRKHPGWSANPQLDYTINKRDWRYFYLLFLTFFKSKKYKWDVKPSNNIYICTISFKYICMQYESKAVHRVRRQPARLIKNSVYASATFIDLNKTIYMLYIIDTHIIADICFRTKGWR